MKRYSFFNFICNFALSFKCNPAQFPRNRATANVSISIGTCKWFGKGDSDSVPSHGTDMKKVVKINKI